MLAPLLFAASAAFVTPFPPPDLVDAAPDAVRVALGDPTRVIAGADALAICKDACDELHVYGPDSAATPTATTASTFVYWKKNRVASVKWIYPGDLTKPGDYPELGRMFEDGIVPVDATVIGHADAVTIDGVTDYARRTIQWRRGSFVWTAVVLCPLVNPFDDRVGQRKQLRKGIMEEYRVALVEAGPTRPPAPPACVANAKEPHRIPPGAPMPKATKKRTIYYPSGFVATPKTTAIVAEIVVGADGKVDGVKVLRSLPGLEPNVTAALRKWTFEPMLCEGTPIAWTSWISATLVSGAP